MASIIMRALPLAALFFSAVTHASPHALGAHQLASRRAVQVREDTPVSSAAPVPVIERIDTAATMKLFIVAFEDGHKYNASFLEEVSAATGASATLETDLTGIVFNGVSIQLSGESPAGLNIEASIASLPGVLEVLQDEPIVPPKINVTTSLNFKKELYSDNLVTPESSNGRLAADPEKYTNDKVMMQVDQLRAQGYTGKGIRVAVMDNAIDTRHPAITVDFVHDYRHPEDVDDPNPECMSHATACAGLVKSSAGPLGFNTGVAPGASLGNYILGGCKHGGHSGLVIQALQQAAEDKVNILSISLGYGNSWKFLESTKVWAKVAEAGVLLVVAAGNGGDEGLWRVQETCAAPGVLCVGMLTNTVVNTWENRNPVTIAGQENNLTMGWLQSEIDGGWPTEPLPVWANMMEGAGGWDGRGGDGCHELPEDVPDLSKYIVLIRRKLCNEDDMIDRVAKAGAKYILISEISGAFPDVFNPDIEREHPTVQALATISGLSGVDLVAALGRGEEVKLTLTKPVLALKERPREEGGKQIGEQMDPGSEWGPTFDAGAGTDISAPGTDIPILQPVGSGGGEYSVATGTSLATPLVAGVAALVMEALGTTDPKVIANVLISTAKPLARVGGDGRQLASTLHQGGGLIRPVSAVAVTAVLETDVLEFNDTLRRQERSFTIANRGSAAITYEVSNQPAGTVFSFRDDGVNHPPSGDDVIRGLYTDGPASLSFSSTRVTVPGNGKATIRVTASDPSSLDAKRLPVWSGFVSLKGSDDSTLTLPYFGIKGDIDRVPKLYGASCETSGVTVPDEELIFLVRYGMGTKASKAYLITTAGELVHEHHLADMGATNVGAWTFGWRGEIEGTQIPAGEYKFRVKALRAFADEKSKNEDDFLLFDSEPFTFKR